MTSEERRKKIRKNLHDLYLPIFDSLCDILPDEWAPYFGFRSEKEQKELFNKGRTSPGKIVTNADAWNSPHNYGMASDWTIWSEEKPIWKLEEVDWEVYRYACEKAGATWGGTFSIIDKFHNELPIKGRWRDVGNRYRDAGLEAAIEYIMDRKL